MQSIQRITSRIGLCVPRAGCSQENFVRYRRKPSWLGFAKTKMFKVPAPKNWPREEEEELHIITQRYHTYMNSLRAFQVEAYNRSLEESRAHAKEISEDAEVGKIAEEIERDNAIVRGLREKALVLEWKQIEEDIIKQRTLLEEEGLREQEAQEKELQFHMERLKSAIKEDGLDEAIEQALSTVKDYNYALDKTGNRYYGRHNSDTPVAPGEVSSVATSS